MVTQQRNYMVDVSRERMCDELNVTRTGRIDRIRRNTARFSHCVWQLARFEMAERSEERDFTDVVFGWIPLDCAQQPHGIPFITRLNGCMQPQPKLRGRQFMNWTSGIECNESVRELTS